MMKVSLVIEAVNRVTGPLNGALSAVKRFGVGIAGAHGRILAMTDGIKDATMHIRRMAGEEGMARASRSAAYLRNQLSGLTSGLSILKYASIGAIVGLGGEFVRGVFKAGGETQQMLVTLQKLEGSAGKARQAMAWMQNFSFGAGASFSMPDIMRSYQQAKNFGMNPQGGSMVAFANLAAVERVPLKQVLLAVKDAMEGTSTRPIANLGIKMRQGKGTDGENSYTYADLTGKQVTTTSAKSPAGTLAALLKIMNAKFGGVALAQASTVPGGIAQLKNMLYSFESLVAQSGVFDWALKRMNSLIGFFNRASKDGSLTRWAKQISDFITGTGDKLFNFLKATDWAAVGKDIAGLAAILGTLASALGLFSSLAGGGLSGVLNLFVVSKIVGITGALYGLVPAVVAMASAVFGFEVVGSPIIAIIGAIVIAVGVLAGAAYLVWANWGGVSAFFKRLWAGMKKDASDGFHQLADPLLAAVPKIKSAWASILTFFKGLWDGLPSPPAWMKSLGSFASGAWNRVSGSLSTSAWAQMLAPAAPRPGPARQTGAWAGARTPHVGGTMTVEFKNAPSGMRVTKVESAHPDFAIAIKRGPVMASQ